MLAHALFEQVDVTIQDKFITSATGHYPYKAMIQTLLKYGNDAKISQLFYKDTPGQLDDDDVKTGSNEGLKVGWLVGFGFNGPLRQYFSLYRAVSQREGERGKKG